MWSRRAVLLATGAFAVTGKLDAEPGMPHERPVEIDYLAPGADALFDPVSQAEELARGFTWSEGPAWDRVRQCLYFTDVPENTAYRWSDEAGLEIFLQPSGVALDAAQGMREPGANGLWFAEDGWLYLCNHGQRGVERLSLETGVRETLCDRFEGQRFNSPNDLVRTRDGMIYFTDPPYGLEGLNASPLKEMDHNGVYVLTPDGACARLVDDMSFPNGIALSPDERWLYIAQSDPDSPIIRRYERDADGQLGAAETWFDAGTDLAAGEPGLPDGLCVAQTGHVFATGPGGVHVLAPSGERLALIRTGRATANCAFGGDGHDLFITAHDRLLRLRLTVKGVQWMS